MRTITNKETFEKRASEFGWKGKKYASQQLEC